MSDLLYGALAGDMASLNGLFRVMLPFVVVFAAVRSLIDRIRRRG